MPDALSRKMYKILADKLNDAACMVSGLDIQDAHELANRLWAVSAKYRDMSKKDTPNGTASSSE